MRSLSPEGMPPALLGSVTTRCHGLLKPASALPLEPSPETCKLDVIRCPEGAGSEGVVIARKRPRGRGSRRT